MIIKKILFLISIFVIASFVNACDEDLEGTWYFYSKLKAEKLIFEKGDIFHFDEEGIKRKCGLYWCYVHKRSIILKFWLGEDYFYCDFLLGDRKLFGVGIHKLYNTYVTKRNDPDNIIYDIRIERIPVKFSLEKLSDGTE